MKTRILTAALLVVAMVIALLVPVTAQSPVSEFDTILLEKLVATDSIVSPDATFSDDLRVDGDLDAYGVLNVVGHTAMSTFETSGNVNVGGTLAVEDAIALSGDVNLVGQTPLTITNGLTPTIAGGLQLIQATGTVTTSDINPGTNYQVVTLVNISNSTIIIPDSGQHRLASAWSGGQWDSITLLYYGVLWIELDRSDN